MVDVEIQDKDPLQAVMANQVFGGNGYIVVHTKPHATTGLGMVPWRTDQGKGVVHLTAKNAISQLQTASGSQGRRV